MTILHTTIETGGRVWNIQNSGRKFVTQIANREYTVHFFFDRATGYGVSLWVRRTERNSFGIYEYPPRQLIDEHYPTLLAAAQRIDAIMCDLDPFAMEALL